MLGYYVVNSVPSSSVSMSAIVIFVVACVASVPVRTNEVQCVARVKILVARKLGREQKRKRSREGVGQRGNACKQTPRF